MKPREYDGFYFVPHGVTGQDLEFKFFKFTSDLADSPPVGTTAIGDTYHVAFFKPDDKGLPTFDDAYEAVFADPQIYVQGLVGSGLYGCVLRKTEKSGQWFQDYLSGLQPDVIIKKLKAMAKSIADN